MKINIDAATIEPFAGPKLGNVYPVRGGRGVRHGHMKVLIAITKPLNCCQGEMALFLIVDREGEPVGVTSYGLHVIEELSPIAFVDGIDQLSLTMRTI